MNIEKQKAADEMAKLLSAVMGYLEPIVDLHPMIALALADLNLAGATYRVAGPWPAPLTPPLEVGDESADPDLGPRNDLLAGLTVALRAAVDDLRNEGTFGAADALHAITRFHPEPEVGKYMQSEIWRLYDDSNDWAPD